jgi:hypothetical protein
LVNRNLLRGGRNIRAAPLSISPLKLAAVAFCNSLSQFVVPTRSAAKRRDLLLKPHTGRRFQKHHTTELPFGSLSGTTSQLLRREAFRPGGF